FTHVTTYRLAKSPYATLYTGPTALLSPPPLRLLPGGTIQFPGGFISRCGPAPFTAHCKRLITTPMVGRECRCNLMAMRTNVLLPLVLAAAVIGQAAEHRLPKPFIVRISESWSTLHPTAG